MNKKPLIHYKLSFLIWNDIIAGVWSSVINWMAKLLKCWLSIKNMLFIISELFELQVFGVFELKYFIDLMETVLVGDVCISFVSQLWQSEQLHQPNVKFVKFVLKNMDISQPLLPD